MKGDKPNNRVLQKVKKRLIILLVLSPFLYIIFNIIKWPIYNSLLDNSSSIISATIIDERNVLGKGVITEMFTYSYEFSINGKVYRGDSKVEGYKIGDKIDVEYLVYYPQINRIKKVKK